MSNNHSVSVLSVCLVVLFLICYGMKPVYSRSVNCASKRWHSSIGCQELTELKVIRKEVHSREKCKIIYLSHIFTGQLKSYEPKMRYVKYSYQFLVFIKSNITCLMSTIHNCIYICKVIENLS